MDDYDVLVVGAGAAGLTAALVLTRARRGVAVVDAGSPRNAAAGELHGFLSRDGLPPAELLAIGRREVAGYGGELIEDKVTGIEPGFGSGFVLRLAGGRTLRARKVVMATGLRDELPELPGVRELWGSDVHVCPFCHGYEVADRAIGVLGTQERSPHQAELLRFWSDDVVYFPDRTTLSADARQRLLAWGVRIEDGEVAGLSVHNGRLDGVRLDGRVVPRSALFLAPRFVPNDELLTGLGCEPAANGFVRTDPMGRTSVAGVWAIGNAANPMAQLITAAAEGSGAASAVVAELLEEDVARAVRDAAPFSAAQERRNAEVLLGVRRHGLLDEESDQPQHAQHADAGRQR